MVIMGTIGILAQVYGDTYIARDGYLEYLKYYSGRIRLPEKNWKRELGIDGSMGIKQLLILLR